MEDSDRNIKVNPTTWTLIQALRALRDVDVNGIEEDVDHAYEALRVIIQALVADDIEKA